MHLNYEQKCHFTEASTHLLGIVICHDQLFGFWFVDNVVTVHIPEVHGSFPVL